MKIGGKDITCDTELSSILDSRKYLLTDDNTDLGSSCSTISKRLESRINTLEDLTYGQNSLISTALVVDGEAQGYNSSCKIINDYEEQNGMFKRFLSNLELEIVGREVAELTELVSCLQTKCLSFGGSATVENNPELKKYDQKWKDADQRLASIRSFYYSLPGNNEFDMQRSKLAEAKAKKSKNKNYVVPKSDYADIMYRNWFSGAMVISGKSAEELGITPRDRAIFDSALETFKKHFENTKDANGNPVKPTPAEMVSYWDQIKSGTTTDYTFGDSERESVKKVVNVINGLDETKDGFNFDICIWAKSSGMSVDDEYFNSYVDERKVNAPYYYKISLDKMKSNNK